MFNKRGTIGIVRSTSYGVDKTHLYIGHKYIYHRLFRNLLYY